MKQSCCLPLSDFSLLPNYFGPCLFFFFSFCILNTLRCNLSLHTSVLVEENVFQRCLNIMIPLCRISIRIEWLKQILKCDICAIKSGVKEPQMYWYCTRTGSECLLFLTLKGNLSLSSPELFTITQFGLSVSALKRPLKTINVESSTKSSWII